MMASPLNASWQQPAIIRACIFCTTPPTSSCNAWTTSATWTTIKTISRPSTSRMPNFILHPAQVSTVDIKIGKTVQGAREGAEFIRNMLIDVPTRAFDDFAGGAQDVETNYRILGLQA